MARRAERTTALPRPRQRTTAPQRRIAGIVWNEKTQHRAILSGAAALLLLVLGLIAYRVYDQKIAVPNKTILSVGGENFSLSYYAERLYGYLQSNQSSGASASILEQQLVTQLENEALTIQLAKEKGINLSDTEITKEIAKELGVPVGGPGSSFDTLYRQKLKDTKLSDTNYRRMAEATLANSQLLAQFTSQVPSSGDLVTIQADVLNDQATAQADYDKVKGGADLGTVAQADSTDPQSKQNNGLMLPEPPALLPSSIAAAIGTKQAGSELFGPTQVQSNWWVFEISKRETGQYSDAQKQQLAQVNLTNAINAKRSSTKITRNLTASDISWAETHA